MKPKYFYKSTDTKMLYAAYPDRSFYAEYCFGRYAPNWTESTLGLVFFVKDSDYAPVSWKDVKAAFPYHSTHKLTPAISSVKEQLLPQTDGMKPA